jgi:hypothetical protein
MARRTLVSADENVFLERWHRSMARASSRLRRSAILPESSGSGRVAIRRLGTIKYPVHICSALIPRIFSCRTHRGQGVCEPPGRRIQSAFA